MLLPVYQGLWAAVDHANHVRFYILLAEATVHIPSNIQLLKSTTWESCQRALAARQMDFFFFFAVIETVIS